MISCLGFSLFFLFRNSNDEFARLLPPARAVANYYCRAIVISRAAGQVCSSVIRYRCSARFYDPVGVGEKVERARGRAGSLGFSFSVIIAARSFEDAGIYGICQVRVYCIPCNWMQSSRGR